jgi:hypothetical protein
MNYKVQPKHLSANYTNILKSFILPFKTHTIETVFACGKSDHGETPVYVVQRFFGSVNNRILLGYIPTHTASIIITEKDISPSTQIKMKGWAYFPEIINSEIVLSSDDLGIPDDCVISRSRVNSNGVIMYTIIYMLGSECYVAQKDKKGKIHTIILGSGEKIISRLCASFGKETTLERTRRELLQRAGARVVEPRTVAIHGGRIGIEFR